MADTCIVCLGDLRTSIATDPLPDTAVPADAEHGGKGNHADTNEGVDSKSQDSDEETIAHLLPCKHDLHNACLKPWVERANSCPICRAVFNMVELSHSVGGPVFDSYPVQDRLQEAELDPGLVVEDELFAVEAWNPCILCGNVDDGHGLMYCDGCDKTVHVFCAGFDDAPDVWYCETCLVDLENDVELPGMASAMTRRSRRRHAPASRPPVRRRRNHDAIWARVWQEVSRRLDFDLDFPFDEEESTDQRTEEQRREFERWQRRFEVANRSGSANRLRGIAAASLYPEQVPPPNPESQEEIRAWNAFDKARESQDAPVTVRRRKRKATDSPSSPGEGTAPSQPQLKRPRLRRPQGASEQPESSTAATRRAADEPTFLSSLLREVESKPTSAGSPTGSEFVNGQFSPRNSSPARSPSSSECGSPRAALTPPPQRPLSPPLSSAILPMTSPINGTFSPFSPIGIGPNYDHADSQRRGRRAHALDSPRSSDADGAHERASSPSTSLSYSTKREIQRMVKLALGSRYRDQEITKDQYTDINRDVSRKLYDLIRDASALADQAEREKWQDVANDEVRRAVAALSVTIDPAE